MLEDVVKEKELKNGENPMMMIMMFLKIEQGLFLPALISKINSVNKKSELPEQKTFSFK